MSVVKRALDHFRQITYPLSSCYLKSKSEGLQPESYILLRSHVKFWMQFLVAKKRHIMHQKNIRFLGGQFKNKLSQSSNKYFVK